jgi:carbon-monoxide dehydrogenase iron sulfur subunit
MLDIRRKIEYDPALCTACLSCELACSLDNFGVCNPEKSGIRIWRDPFWRYEQAFICRHCEEPACRDACMTGCITKDYEQGTVIQEVARCVGCRMCVMVCPHGAIFAGPQAEVAFKCDLCPDRDKPACVAVCVTEALKCVEGE